MPASTAAPAAATADTGTGVDFAADGAGQRSSTPTARAIVADALRAGGDVAAATACERESRWRQRYIEHAHHLVALAAQSPEHAVPIARAGLASAHARLQFVRDGERPLATAMSAVGAPLHSATVHGTAKAGPAAIGVPYQGQMLVGDGLRRQLDRWEHDGVVEPAFAQALWRVQSNPDWLDLSDQAFALLGAAAELSPLPWLLRWRARVYAVDLPRPALWTKLARLAQAGNGALVAPCRGMPPTDHGEALAQAAGVDLIADTPEIAAWLASARGPLTVGAYAYLDGARHLRVAAAMDAVQAHLCGTRRDVSLAMLATPTDAYAVPAAALAAARERYAARGPLARLVAAVTAGRGLACNGEPLEAGGADVAGIVDALVVQQGPNYVLAKRLQHWRALSARADGVRVSIHVAPPALTASVLSNRLIGAAYRAAWRFGAQAFEPATAAALMAALLVHDLRHPAAVAQPTVALSHPLQLLNDAACHGGLWRMPFAARSALPAAAVLGLLAPR